MWMKDFLRYLRQLSFHAFMHFYGIKFESKNLFEIFVVNSLNYSFFKRFFLINFDKVVFLRTQIDTSICVLNIFN